MHACWKCVGLTLGILVLVALVYDYVNLHEAISNLSENLGRLYRIVVSRQGGGV